ncbi:MAG: very short patch repair endonuclease [Planctomycetota bacterium]
MADVFDPPTRAAVMRAVARRDTTPELIVRRALHRMGYRYRLDAADLPGRPDLVFPARRKVVFVHGCFWHAHHCPRGARIPASRTDYWRAKIDRNRRRDARVAKQLRRMGWSVAVVWECALAPRRRDAAIARLCRFLGPPGLAGALPRTAEAQGRP